MTQYAFYFDSARCTGCKTCELACKDYQNLDKNTAYRHVFDYEGGSWTINADGTCQTDAFVYHVSVSCNHCDNPACTGVCPTGAMHKNPETGLVSVNTDKCIGCGYCHMACPYNAPRVDRALGHSVKCDGCASRVEAGLNPICVDACPLRALEFGPVSEMAALGEQANIAPLPESHYTNPHLYIKVNENAKVPGSAEGSVANVMEVL